MKCCGVVVGLSMCLTACRLSVVCHNAIHDERSIRHDRSGVCVAVVEVVCELGVVML